MMRQVVAPLSRTVFRNNQAARSGRRYHGIDHKQPTMDDLPVPMGSWEAQNKITQSKYNLHLLLGIVFSSVTLIAAKTSGLINLNYTPPSLD